MVKIKSSVVTEKKTHDIFNIFLRYIEVKDFAKF